jgi:nucleotide-binding universal stress UspA family protein
MKILTLYDGTIQSKTALRYGLKKARETGGELIILQVFQSSLFLDYDAGPRAEELARAEAARHRLDAENIIYEAGEGAAVRMVSEDGEAVPAAVRLAETERVELLLASPRYKALARTAPCPVHIMPGTILVPVDSSEALMADKDLIIEEARATNSKVLLLGIVPVHLYSAAEKKELDAVRGATGTGVGKILSALRGQGLQVSETIRSGYPDEEILRAAEEHSATLIMLPSGGKTPSELTKAAAILLDEPERIPLPVRIIRAAEAS